MNKTFANRPRKLLISYDKMTILLLKATPKKFSASHHKNNACMRGIKTLTQWKRGNRSIAKYHFLMVH